MIVRRSRALKLHFVNMLLGSEYNRFDFPESGDQGLNADPVKQIVRSRCTRLRVCDLKFIEAPKSKYGNG